MDLLNNICMVIYIDERGKLLQANYNQNPNIAPNPNSINT